MGVFISSCTYAVAPSGVKMYLRFYCKESSKCTNLCSQLVLHNNMNTLRQKRFVLMTFGVEIGHSMLTKYT